MFHVVPGKKGRDKMGFTDKNVVVPSGGLCAKEYRKCALAEICLTKGNHCLSLQSYRVA